MISFLLVTLQESWQWVLGAGIVGIILVMLVIHMIKKVIYKIIAVILAALAAGMGGGMISTAHEYWDQASEKGVSVVEYVSDYVGDGE